MVYRQKMYPEDYDPDEDDEDEFSADEEYDIDPIEWASEILEANKKYIHKHDSRYCKLQKKSERSLSFCRFFS